MACKGINKEASGPEQGMSKICPQWLNGVHESSLSIKKNLSFLCIVLFVHKLDMPVMHCALRAVEMSLVRRGGCKSHSAWQNFLYRGARHDSCRLPSFGHATSQGLLCASEYFASPARARVNTDCGRHTVAHACGGGSAA